MVGGFYFSIESDELEKVLGGTAARELGQLFRESKMFVIDGKRVLALDDLAREEIWKLFEGARFNLVNSNGDKVENQKIIKRIAKKNNGKKLVELCYLEFIWRFFPELKCRTDLKVAA